MAFHVKTWNAMRCKRHSYSAAAEHGAEISRHSGSAGGLARLPQGRGRRLGGSGHTLFHQKAVKVFRAFKV